MVTTKTFEQLAAEKYPIYTGQKKNPETGKPDCPLTIHFKLRARTDYIKKLENAANGCSKCVETYNNLLNQSLGK